MATALPFTEDDKLDQLKRAINWTEGRRWNSESSIEAGVIVFRYTEPFGPLHPMLYVYQARTGTTYENDPCYYRQHFRLLWQTRLPGRASGCTTESHFRYLKGTVTFLEPQEPGETASFFQAKVETHHRPTDYAKGTFANGQRDLLWRTFTARTARLDFAQTAVTFLSRGGTQLETMLWP